MHKGSQNKERCAFNWRAAGTRPTCQVGLPQIGWSPNPNLRRAVDPFLRVHEHLCHCITQARSEARAL